MNRYFFWTNIPLAMGILVLTPVVSPALDTDRYQMMSSAMPGFQSMSAYEEDEVPRYQPPADAKPGGRIDGTVRGHQGDVPTVFVLAPKDHIGLTMEAQPSLYWYLSEPTTHPLTFTMTTAEAIQPLVEMVLDPPREAGVQEIDLKKLGMILKTGLTYRWFITLTLDPDSPSSDIVAGASVERVNFVEAQLIYLPAAQARDPVALAKAGLWYDTLEAVSQQIQDLPDDEHLRQQRAALLEQVDLPQVARDDLEAVTTR